jgi:SAM-dependent methyltransferase
MSRTVTHVNRQSVDRPWRIWDLDAETRYWPVIDALPDDDERSICEIGSGPAGLASWTPRPVIGVDPGADERHGGVAPLSNLRRVLGDGSAIPLESRSVGAAVAVETFEHIPRAARPAVAAELIRVTRPGGRVIVMGPAGAAAGRADRWLLDHLEGLPRVPEWSIWLSEHMEMGLPTVPELEGLFADRRVARVTSTGYFNVALWRIMHFAALHGPRLGPAHAPLWGMFARLAHRYRRGPFYRWLVVADLHAE